MRNAFSIVLRQLLGWVGLAYPSDDAMTMRAAQVTSALHSREKHGRTTTLRELHTISGLEQSQALSVVDALEREGVVMIERDLGDAFASTVSLSDVARRRLDRATEREAA